MKEKASTLEKIPFGFSLDILKQMEESGEFHVVGYAATTDFDLQGDIITEEALKDSSVDLLSNSTVLLNHDIERSIGKVTKAEFDKNGLLIDVLISQTEPDIIQKIKEGVLNKFSIRGQVLEREKKFMSEFDRVVNVIKKMILVEVSLVSVPANPEARAIGWYVKKALDEIDSLKKEPPAQGGNPMSKKETVVEEPKPEDPKPEDTPASADPKPEDPKPEPEKTPAPSDPPPEKVAGKESKSKKEKEDEALKESDLVAKLEPVWPMLDRLIAIGGDVAPAAVEIKSALKEAVGETWTPPVIVPPAAPTFTKEEVAAMISSEIKKQIEPLLKQIPAQRKGIVQSEPETNDIKKTFEGLPPEKKLKVALALQQG